METTVIDILRTLIENHRELTPESIDEELEYAIELLEVDDELFSLTQEDE
jgi:hypothetical protein